jgi:phage terminase large subunit-like protein
MPVGCLLGRDPAGSDNALKWQLAHRVREIAQWRVTVAVESDAAGNLKPSKKKSTERIDGIVAAIMGLGRAMVGAPAFESVYETSGLICI